jgi:hypothetical protein
VAIINSINSVDVIASRQDVLAGILSNRLESYEIIQHIDQMRGASTIQMVSAVRWRGKLQRTRDELEAIGGTFDSQGSLGSKLRDIDVGEIVMGTVSSTDVE